MTENSMDMSYQMNRQKIIFKLLMPRLEAVLKTMDLLDMMQDNFVLAARTEHTDRRSDTETFYSKYIKEPVSDVIVLTFVNKRIIDKTELPWNQTSYIAYNKKHKSYSGTYNSFKPTTISKVVVLNQKLKNLKERLSNK